MYVDMTEMCVIISNTMLFRNKKIDILILHEKQGQAKPRAREELRVEDWEMEKEWLICYTFWI